MSKLNKEQATKEFKEWLDTKKVSEKKRIANEGFQDTIVDAIMDGDMIINEDKTIDLKLKFPIINTSGKEAFSSLIFKHRMTVGERSAACKGVKAEDGEGRIIGYVAALSSMTRGEINKLDSGEDFERASALAVYFL